MAQIKIPRITKAQELYIEQLSIDLQFNRKQRNAHISSILSRPVGYLDELTLADASNVIEIFKRWKENKKQPTAAAEED